MTYVMTIKRVVTAIALASLMGIVLPVATAQAPPCFTFADGQTQAFQCPAYFRPPVPTPGSATGAYYATGVRTDPGILRDPNIWPPNIIDGSQAQPPAIPLVPSPEPTISNNASAAGINQTQTAPPAATNLTSADIEPVRDGLNTVRQSLEHNDTQALIESINRADGALFAIITQEGKGPVREQLSTLSDDIQTTRESVLNQDNAKALADLNAADSQLLVITEMLDRPTPTPAPTPTATEEPLNENQTNSNSNGNGVFFGQQEAPAIQSPAPAPAQEAEQQQEPTINIKIPLNQTQQELVTIEEVAGLNKTTHEKTTITIVQGNKTTHREITTTEVPL